MYDVIIIGAGPIGLACGIEAAKRNKKFLIIEKGCLVNSIFHYPTNMTFFSTSERLEIGDVPFVSHGDKPTRREALEYYRRIADAWKLNINSYEEVHSVKKAGTEFIVETAKGSYSSANVIIATGFFDKPNLLNIPGVNLPKVKHYFDEAHPYAYLNVAVIGGGNSAVDVALETFRRNSNVTMVIRGAGLKDSVKYWVRPDIENRITEGSIKAYFNSIVTGIEKDSIEIKTPDRVMRIDNDFVFAMTGYHPDFNFLQRAGVNTGRNGKDIFPLFDADTFETSVPGLYLAGVVCGGTSTGKWFIENSRYHAGSIFDSIDGKKSFK